MATAYRFSGAHGHRFLFNFVKAVGDHYVKDGRPQDFIIDLLSINVPKLFGLPADTDVQGHAVAVEVQNEFTSFVLNYILTNALKAGLLQKMSHILVGV